MSKSQKMFEQEIAELTVSFEESIDFKFLRDFFDSMQEQGLVVKQEYTLKSIDPLVPNEPATSGMQDSWFTVYLNHHQ